VDEKLRSQLPFEFKVLDAPVVNAFALPGGYVYLTRGILSYCNSEAELAGVIRHEFGHVVARHYAKQYTRAQWMETSTVPKVLGNTVKALFWQPSSQKIF
jgi:predicted Zn-dependent protease